jgi:ATP-binding cassette subfamily B protein
MTLGDLTMMTSYITLIYGPLRYFSRLPRKLVRTGTSMAKIFEIIDEEEDVSDAENAKDINIEGTVEFKNVCFRYFKHSEDRVLSDINLTIKAGSTVGIIGPTGCGKTSLVSMIPRLYDVDEGQVLVDGVDVRDYSLFNLREGVGMVLQKNVLFSGTIEENLRWGNQDATDEQIRTAADHAQAHKFVQNFPDGYATNLDQGGTNVSGGQKQRLCIARALLKSPKILILDDSTSAVDTATEAQIRQAFASELKDSTKIIIAQRISSVMDADYIVVMDQGEITGIGTHAELLESNEEYKEIYISQMESKQNQAAAPTAAAKEVTA